MSAELRVRDPPDENPLATLVRAGQRLPPPIGRASCAVGRSTRRWPRKIYAEGQGRDDWIIERILIPEAQHRC